MELLHHLIIILWGQAWLAVIGVAIHLAQTFSDVIRLWILSHHALKTNLKAHADRVRFTSLGLRTT